MGKVEPRPKNMNWVNPYLTVKDVSKAVEFYQKAFGFQKVMVLNGENGEPVHAEVQHKDCVIMLGTHPDQTTGTKSPNDLGGTSVRLYIYTENVDAFIEKAQKVGAKILEKPTDQYWGDRTGSVRDPEGHIWWIATHVKDIAPKEMAAASKDETIHMSSLKAASCLLALVSLGALRGPAYAGTSGVESLSWLSGCWRQELPDGYFEEYWMAPAGQTILHMGRMVSEGRTAFYETLQIREQDGRLSLQVTINGKRQVLFEVVESGSRKVVFQTPVSAPWERLTYEKPSENELTARLEKKRNGRTTEDEFRMKRVDCQKALSP